ncbi:thermonuclease family protein [Rhizobium leguminosarum]
MKILKVLAVGFSVAMVVWSTAAAGARVIDGDTIDVAGIRYRLHGIDAPEAGQTCAAADGGVWPCGQAALHKMETLLLGHEVRCKAKDRDMYGRVIAICEAGGKEINAEMIKSGLAWAFRKYSTDYVELEETAKPSGIGIWQAETQTAWEYRAHRWDTETAAATVGGCPIKGNINRKHEKIYHAPWSKDYARTRIDPGKGERWFCTEAEAVSAGWRAAGFGN